MSQSGHVEPLDRWLCCANSLIINHEQRKLSQRAPRRSAASFHWSQLKTADPKREVEALLTLYRQRLKRNRAP
jgi:hypothetical protein